MQDLFSLCHLILFKAILKTSKPIQESRLFLYVRGPSVYQTKECEGEMSITHPAGGKEIAKKK